MILQIHRKPRKETVFDWCAWKSWNRPCFTRMTHESPSKFSAASCHIYPKKASMTFSAYQAYHTLDHSMSSHWTSDEFTRSQLASFLNQLTYTVYNMGLSNVCSSQQTTQVTFSAQLQPSQEWFVCPMSSAIPSGGQSEIPEGIWESKGCGTGDDIYIYKRSIFI